jgi:hypothetical protein
MIVRKLLLGTCLMPLACAVAAQAKPDADHAAEMSGIEIESKLFGHTVFGGGYADFTSGGAPGANSYWVFAQGIGRLGFGRWYADVRIGFTPTPYDFRALYSVDCIEVDRSTREAWIDGTVLDSNRPANIGRRAFLYIKDGGGIPGADFHAITPLAAGVDCRQRPQPNFREQTESGNFYVER